MTWDCVVTKHHKRYLKEIGVTTNIEAYMQSRVLKTTLEAISLEHRRGILDGYEIEEEAEMAVERVINAAMIGIKA